MNKPCFLKRLLLLFIPLHLGLAPAKAEITRGSLNTKSARLDALGLILAVTDETNIIGINKYGGNPAGIMIDEPRSRVLGAAQIQKSHNLLNSSKVSESSLLDLGIFAVTKTSETAIQGELSGQQTEIDPVMGTGYNSDAVSGLLSYNHRWGGNLLGVEINRFNLTEGGTGSGTQRSDPLGIILGWGHTTPVAAGRLDLGLSAGWEEAETTHSDGSISTQEYGAQMVFDNLSNFVWGLGFSRGNGDEKLNASQDRTDEKTSELKSRLIMTPVSIPIHVGLEGRIARETTKTNSFSGARTLDTQLNSTEFGGGITFIDERGLIGVEGKRTNNDLDDNILNQTNKTDFKRIGIGTEINLGPLVQLRASYFENETERETLNLKTIQDEDIVGVGFGIKLNDSGKLDFSYRNNESKTPGTVTTQSRSETYDLVATFYFSGIKSP